MSQQHQQHQHPQFGEGQQLYLTGKAEQLAEQLSQMDGMIKNCYKSCLPNPGTQLSKSEKACVVNCGDKYLTSLTVMMGTLENAANIPQ